MEGDLDSLLNAAREVTLAHITGYERYSYMPLDFFHAYNAYRLQRPKLTDSELQIIKAVMPCEEALAREGIYFNSALVFDLLQMRSAVAFLTDDFPHLADLKYHEQVLRMDALVETWKSSTDGKYNYFSSFARLREQFNETREGKTYPRSHTWWDITSHLLTINGKPIEEAEQDHLKRMEYLGNMHANRRRFGHRNPAAPRHPRHAAVVDQAARPRRRTDSTETAVEMDENEMRTKQRVVANFEAKRRQLDPARPEDYLEEHIPTEDSSLRAHRIRDEARLTNQVEQLLFDMEHGETNESSMDVLLPRLFAWLERVKMEQDMTTSLLNDVRNELTQQENERDDLLRLENYINKLKISDGSK